MSLSVQLLSPLATAEWLRLSEDERIQWSGRSSAFTIALSVGGGLLFAAVGVGLLVWSLPWADSSVFPRWVGYAPLVITAVGLGKAALAYLHWIRLRYVITDEQVYVKYGLFSRDVTQIRLDRIQNTSYEQSILERLLGFGDVRLYTAGTDAEDITLRSVPEPGAVKQIVTDRLSDRVTERRESA